MKTKILLLAIAIGACIAILRYDHVLGGAFSVREVTVNPRQFIGKAIHVKGTVGNSVGLLGVGGFQLKDEDGSTLTVVSSRGMPVAGERLVVTGVIRQIFTSGAEQEVILVEVPDEHYSSHNASQNAP